MLDWREIPDDSEKGKPKAPPHDAGRLRPAEELLLSARRLADEGEFRLAAREFGGARRHDATLLDAWAEEVGAHVRAGELSRAAAVAAEALEAHGPLPLFQAAQALVLAHQGSTDAALERSEAAARGTDPGMFVWLSRGEVVLAADADGTMRTVEACFERASQRDPSRWRAKFRAALALLRWGHTERALERLAQVAQLASGNPFVWTLMGDCHRDLGRDPDARRCYRAALSRRRGYAPALEALRSMTLWGRLRAQLARVFKRKRST